MISKGDLELITKAMQKVFDPRFDAIDRRLEGHDKQLKSIKKDTRNLNMFAKHFDREHQKSKKRLDRIENHLSLPSID